MTISFTPTVDPETSELASVVSRVLGCPVTAVDSIGGGRNSQVYRVTGGNSAQYVAKRYCPSRFDGRNRLDIEFSALRFLWTHGVRNIPQPIGADPEQECAVYAYLDGTRLSTQDLANADIDDAVRFLAELKALRNTRESHAIPPASEACFSVQAILDNMERRLRRLPQHRHGEAPYDALADFLASDFLPSRAQIIRWCHARLEAFGSSFHAVVPQQEQTLSPSDFGFHNALRLRDGGLVYLDFEYFGWDDPAKLIVDFVIHPAMELPEPLARRFVSSLFGLFGEDRHLVDRTEVVYPLFGLTWCLILLNEFIPDDLRRRGFAGGMPLRTTDLQMAQLVKTKRLLHRVMGEYEHFPYRV